MEFELHRTSDGWSKTKKIELNTLEDLLKLIDIEDENIIVSKDIDGEYCLEIYDTWRE